MKKLLSLALAIALALSLAACGNSPSNTSSSGNETNSTGKTEELAGGVPDTITVTGLNGNSEEIQVEVPYNPQRIVVVDYAKWQGVRQNTTMTYAKSPR